MILQNTKRMDRKLKIFQSLVEINKFAAQKIISVGNKSIKQSGHFTLALAGGTTPKLLYQLLATNEFKNAIEWDKVFFFFGDERDVSPMSDRSNFRMVNENLFKPLGIAPENIMRWQTEIINATEVAENYGKTIARFFKLSPGEFPRFDFILLGMGDDGHTASLFPNTDALKEKSKIAVSNYVEKFDSERLTFTYPTINSALNIFFIVAGEEKAAALKEVFEGNSNPTKFPSQRVTQQKGSCLWLVDVNAAGLLNK